MLINFNKNMSSKTGEIYQKNKPDVKKTSKIVLNDCKQ